MSSKYWKLPSNWVDLVESVKWAAGGELSLEVQAPLTVTAELLCQNEGREMILHLINYDAARHVPVKDIRVRLRTPTKHQTAKQVSVYSPDVVGVLSLSFTAPEGQISFSVPTLETYRVIRIA